MHSARDVHSQMGVDLGGRVRSGVPWNEVAELRTLSLLAADIADALSRSSSLRHSLHACAEAIVRRLDAAFARIWTLNEKENVLELRASAGLYTHLDGPHSRVPVGQLKIGLIAQESKPHFTNTVIGDPRVNDQEWARREGMVAFAGHPLLCEDRPVGVMALFSRRPLSSSTLQALKTVATSIAYGITHWRTVEALGASEERFALAVQGTAEGIWDWNILTNEVYLAPRFKELLGYEEHEFEGSYASWESRLHPEDRDRVLEALQQHLTQRHTFQVDYRLRAKPGDYRWFQARGQALWDDDGRAVRMLGSIRDIAGRKLTEKRSAAVHQVTRVLAETSEWTESLPKICKLLCAMLNWDVGEFWVRDPNADVLRLAAFSHLPSASMTAFHAASRQFSFQRGVGLPGRTWASARPEWVQDVTRDTNFPRAAAAAEDNLHGAVAFPILIRGEVYGVMEFFTSCVIKPDAELIVSLADISLQISRCIELQKERDEVQKHKHELAIASQIQQRMFPKTMPVLEGFEIAAASKPATAAGGDYFDVIQSTSEHLLLALGDVSGHGLGPALVAASARAYTRVLTAMDISIDRIMHMVNKRLTEDLDEQFMSLFLGVINPLTRSLVYCNAGHCPGLIIDTPGGEVRKTLPASVQPLGIDLHHKYHNSDVVQLLPGDLLLLHSDGISEASGPSGGYFGMARVVDTVRASRHLPADAIIAALFGAVHEFTQSAPRDDITAIVVKVARTA